MPPEAVDAIGATVLRRSAAASAPRWIACGAVAIAHVNGIDVYYERSGSGRRLLFLNGSGATLAGTGVHGLFREGFDLLAHDQRGLGQTEIPPGPYSMADYAADAAGLLDHVGWESAAVVGISFGGMVAQELAVTHPDRIDRLALLCTSPGGEMPSYPLHELVALDPAERAQVRVPLLDTRYTPEWLAEHPDQQAFVDLLTRVPAEAPPAEQLRGEWEQLDARRRHDVVERLGAITCPTLVASGRFDGIAPLANGEAIAERVPTAELRAYDGGHLFMVQDKRAIPEILEFLAG